MACPSCSHMMEGFSNLPDPTVFWCPRCGTVRRNGSVSVPNLVPRCREFGELLHSDDAFDVLDDEWHNLGIDESIYMP